MRHFARHFAPLVLALMGLLIAIAPALAASPTLVGQITDQVGKVNTADPTITAAIDSLRSGHGINMRVLLTDSMRGVDPGTYAQDVADANLLGANDGLLIITFSDRKFGLWVGPGITSVSKSEIDAVLNGAVAQHLRSGDTAGAIVAAADALGAAAAGNVAEATPPPPATPAPPAKPLDLSGFFALLGFALLALLALACGYLVITALAAFGKARSVRAVLLAKMQSLMDSSASAVVSTDEALKDALQKVDFVASEYGESTAAPYRKALTPLSATMNSAFALAAKFQDPNFTVAEDPDVQSEGGFFTRFFTRGDATAFARRDGYQQILDMVGQINTTLAPQAAELDKLRDLENTLATRLPGLQAKLAAARTAIAAADPRLAALTKRSPSAAQTVATNVSGASGLADLAGKDLATAAASSSAKGVATMAAQNAEGRLAKIDVLLAAITTMAGQVDSAEKALPVHLASATVGIAKAAVADTRDDVKGEERDIKVAQAKLDEAKRLASSDPYAADTAALEALREADAVIGEVADAVDARERKEAAAKEALAAAQRAVTQAQTYINSHRSVVSAGARTSLAQASAQIGAYHEGMDPLQLYLALAVLQAIAANAASAYKRAQNDVSAHEEESSYSSGYSSSSHDTFGGGMSSGGSWGGRGDMSSGGSWGGGGGTSSGGGW